jgi:hypothetical protein
MNRTTVLEKYQQMLPARFGCRNLPASQAFDLQVPAATLGAHDHPAVQRRAQIHRCSMNRVSFGH